MHEADSLNHKQYIKIYKDPKLSWKVDASFTAHHTTYPNALWSAGGILKSRETQSSPSHSLCRYTGDSKKPRLLPETQDRVPG